MDLEQKHSLAIAARVSGIPAQTIKSYLHKSLASADAVETPGGTGNRRGYSFNAIMELTIARFLMELGLASKRAFQIARQFANFGRGESGWVGEERRMPDQLPGMPYHYALGDTYIVAGVDCQAIVLHPKQQEEAYDVYPIMIDVWPIFSHVVKELGGDPFKLLDDTYGIHSGADLTRFQVNG